MKKLLALSLLSVLGLAAIPARADDAGSTATVEALYAEGAALYRAGKYRQAIERFEQAYATYPEPNLLYNIGRSHEALGEHDQAISAYDRCATAKDAAPSVREKAAERTKMLRQAKLKSETAPVEDEPLPALEPTRPAAKLTRRAEPKSSGLTVAKWVTAGTAVAVIATGGIVYALGASDHGKLQDARDSATGGVANLGYNDALDLEDGGRQKKTIGVALLCAGGGAAILSGVFFALDGDDEPEVASVGVAPTDDGGVLGFVGGRF